MAMSYAGHLGCSERNKYNCHLSGQWYDIIERKGKHLQCTMPMPLSFNLTEIYWSFKWHLIKRKMDIFSYTGNYSDVIGNVKSKKNCSDANVYVYFIFPFLLFTLSTFCYLILLFRFYSVFKIGQKYIFACNFYIKQH